MKNTKLWLFALSVVAGSHISYSQLVNAFPNLTFSTPVLVTHAGDGTNRVFVVEKTGRIKVFPNDPTAAAAATFLNIADKLSSTAGGGEERGLLGLAFHPNYMNNGYLYVAYTAAGPARDVISRFSVIPGNANKADSLSEYKILEISDPYDNHNGGMVFFGTDGYLYFGSGDGGSGGDPENRAQNLDELLGKIIRLNVDSTQGALHYAIPPTNPLVGISGRDEIFAWGMRNPFRFTQDPVTGYIYAGDVGQGDWEEISIIENGKNYGWRCYEGTHTYNTSGCTGVYTGPIKEYSSSGTECTVIGGNVYRGYRRPDFVGAYTYADYCSGKIWRLRYNGVSASPETLIVDASFQVTGFGMDQQNELYICNYTSGNIQRFSGPNLILAATTHFSPSNGSSNQPAPVTLKWRQTAGATKYCLEMSTNSGFTSLALFDSTLTDTSYVASGLTLGGQYYWRVRTKTSNGWGNYAGGWSFTVASIPSAPLLVSPSNGSTNQALMPVLGWNASAGSTTYRLQVSTDSLFGSTLFDDSTITTLSQQIGPLANTTPYFWQVRGKNAGGTGPFSATWKFTTTAAITVSYPVSLSWGLLSLPLTVNDPRKGVLFPMATSDAYRFSNSLGYVNSDSMFNGVGYFLKFDSTQNVNVTGVPREQDTIDVVPGWNLVGSLTDPVVISSIVENPPGIIQSAYYGYNGIYAAADTIHPAKAYWVKANAAGQLIFAPALVARPISKTVPSTGNGARNTGPDAKKP